MHTATDKQLGQSVRLKWTNNQVRCFQIAKTQTPKQTLPPNYGKRPRVKASRQKLSQNYSISVPPSHVYTFLILKQAITIGFFHEPARI
ncbi:hypothetical protein C7972_105139 [Arenibacter sp. ARW7G5Y1]|nr:hypothetical protein C7972_105139 [Arenibacter sp. ARW7G5Y1]